MTRNPADDGARLTSAERRVVGVAALVAMLRMFGLFALLPVLSLYAARLDGATPLLIGFAVGAYGLTQAVFQLPMGALSDRIGRLPVILLGLAVFAAGSAAAAVSDTIYGVVGGRLLQGAGAVASTLGALIGDATRAAVRTRSMAALGIGIGAAFMLAMALGPVIAANLGVPALFWLAALLAGVAAALLAFLPATPRAEPGPCRNVASAFRPALLQIDTYVFLLHAMMTATFVALPFLLSERLDLAAGEHWRIYVGALVLSLAVAVPMILRDRDGGRASFVAAAVVMLLVSQLGLAFVSFSDWTVLLALAVYFAGFNFLEASLPARLSILSGESKRGASMGVFSSAQFLGAFGGGLLGGLLLGSGEPRNVFIACALLAATWLAISTWNSSKTD